MAAMVLSTLGMQAEDKVTAKVSGTNLNIGLENSTSFVAFQMDIQLPAGVTASKVDKTGRLKQGANVTIEGVSTETPFVIASNVLEGNVLRVIAYNLGNNIIEDATGDLLNIALSDAVADPSEVKLNTILFVKSSDLTESALDNVIGEEGRVTGDVNGKDGFNFFDVTDIIEMYLGKKAPTAAADVNGKDGFNFFDVTDLIDYFLGKKTL